MRIGVGNGWDNKMKQCLIIITLLFSYNAMAESRLLYDPWERDAYLLCVDEKLWVYTFIGLGMETTSTRSPYYDASTETKSGMEQQKCSTGI